MNNLTWKHIAVIGIVLYLVGFVTFVLSQPVEVVDNEEVLDTYVNDEVQSANNLLREEFVNGCSAEGVSEAYCNCTYNYMVGQVGIDGFKDEVMQFNQTGQFSDLMLDAVDECLHLL